jgi:hypothetical protein
MVRYKSLVLCTNEWFRYHYCIPLYNEWLATSLWTFTNEWLGITIPLYNEWLATDLWFSVYQWMVRYHYCSGQWMVSYKPLVLCTNEWLGITIALDSEWLATNLWSYVPMNGYRYHYFSEKWMVGYQYLSEQWMRVQLSPSWSYYEWWLLLYVSPSFWKTEMNGLDRYQESSVQ